MEDDLPRKKKKKTKERDHSSESIYFDVRIWTNPLEPWLLKYSMKDADVRNDSSS